MPCPSERTRAWTMHDVVTVSRGVEVGGPLELVVSRTGSTTVAWTAAPGGFGLPQIIGVADVPRAPGDPQIPLGPPDAQDPLDAQVDAAIGRSGVEAPGSHLGIDGADVQTLLWQQDLLTPPGPEQDLTEFYDVAVAERAPGAGWSTAPSLGLGYVDDAQLAVNASGAAVVAWHQFIGRRSLVYASYRATAGAGWTSPQRVPRVDGLMQVGIDDAGRVLLMYLHDSPRKRDGERACGRSGAPRPAGGGSRTGSAGHTPTSPVGRRCRRGRGGGLQPLLRCRPRR